MKLMKLALFGVALCMLAITIYARSSRINALMIPEPPSCSVLPVFTSLTIDPVKPGGLTEHEIQNLLSQGWTDNYLDGNHAAARVQFKKSDGTLEWRCGPLYDGTRVLRGRSHARYTLSVWKSNLS